MATLTDYRTFFKQDNYEQIGRMIEDFGIATVITAAAICSKDQPISPNMTRLILFRTISTVSVHHFIWSADDMINGDDTFMPDDSLLNLLSVYILSQSGCEDIEPKAVAQELIHVIGTCNVSEFKQILSFVAKADMVLILSDDVLLAMLERIKRIFQDDRVFFLMLHSAMMSSILEETVSEVALSQGVGESIIAMLKERGYEVEIVPETDDFPIPNLPEKTDAPPVNSYQAATSSSFDWFAQHSRRRRGRRYGR